MALIDHTKPRRSRPIEGGAVEDADTFEARLPYRDPAMEAARERIARKRAQAIESIEVVERLSDGVIGPVGLDGVIGLIPGVGAAYSVLAGVAIIGIAGSAGVSFGTLVKMLLVVVFDVLIGAFVGIGDFFDFLFRGHAIIGQMARQALLDADLRDQAYAAGNPDHWRASTPSWIKGLAVVGGLLVLLYACTA